MPKMARKKLNHTNKIILKTEKDEKSHSRLCPEAGTIVYNYYKTYIRSMRIITLATVEQDAVAQSAKLSHFDSLKFDLLCSQP